MFVRKNKNRSGSVSVQIVQKTQGKTKIIQTVGVGKDLKEIHRLTKKAETIIPKLCGQPSLLPLSDKDLVVKNFLEGLTNLSVQVTGPELVFGALFDRIGFNKINDPLFRHLVIARLAYPGSKLRTVDYLERYQGRLISVDRLYRFLDDLSGKHQGRVEQIAFNDTKKKLRGKVAVIFYDLTTLYFETESEDDLRRVGYSKDGKWRKPQVMLGLLVAANGYPIGYDIFAGNTFEGHTLIPAIKRLEKKFNLKRPVVVADAGLLNQTNLSNLAEGGYSYILGARIKNEPREIKDQIISANLTDQQTTEIQRADQARLIIGYSTKRAKKDVHNRKRGLRRLEKNLRSGKLTKAQINNRGYNKYLKLTGKVEVTIDYQKFKTDHRWDGLKGYVTNSSLSARRVIQSYNQLWQIEKAFRISKTDLKVRPVYHRLERRIKAHICVAFTAYTVYKELERLLYRHQAPFSPRRASELTQTMYQITYTLPESLKEEKQLLKMSEEQETLVGVIHKKA